MSKILYLPEETLTIHCRFITGQPYPPSQCSRKTNLSSLNALKQDRGKSRGQHPANWDFFLKSLHKQLKNHTILKEIPMGSLTSNLSDTAHIYYMQITMLYMSHVPDLILTIPRDTISTPILQPRNLKSQKIKCRPKGLHFRGAEWELE